MPATIVDSNVVMDLLEPGSAWSGWARKQISEARLSGELAHCRRCGHAFSSRMHIEDLIEVERQLGFAYEIPGGEDGHYQWICPRCRRILPALAQARLWQAANVPKEFEQQGN